MIKIILKILSYIPKHRPMCTEDNHKFPLKYGYGSVRVLKDKPCYCGEFNSSDEYIRHNITKYYLINRDS